MKCSNRSKWSKEVKMIVSRKFNNLKSFTLKNLIKVGKNYGLEFQRELTQLFDKQNVKLSNISKYS